MADYTELKSTIDNNVNTNGERAITGSTLNTTLKTIVDTVNSTKQDPGTGGGGGFVTCSTTGSSAAKLINDATTIPNFTLDKGVRLLVKFEHANTVANPTLNINSTGATSIKYNGTAASVSNTWVDNEVVDLYYDGSYYILMPCLNVDDEPTVNSANLVKSGGVLQEILRNFHDVSKNITTTITYQNIFEIPLIAGRKYKFKVERDTSETDPRYIYIKDNSFVEGSSSSGTILVNLTMNYSSSVHEFSKEVIYIPSTTQIGHLTCNVANKSFSFYAKVYIEETDLNESVIDNIEGYVNEQTSQIKSLSELQQYDGWLDSSLKIISHSGCKYVVIPVKNGDVVSKTETTEGYFVIVKEFTYNPTLPYTFVFATGESARRNAVTNLTMPSDAKYILLMVTQYNGTSNLPSSMTINGVDITKSLEERLNTQVNAVSTRVTSIENFDASLDNDIIDNNFEGTRIREESMVDYFDGDDVTYRGVTVECNSDGTFVFSDTATSSGGGARYSNKFTLNAGTYIGKIIKTDEGLPDAKLLNYTNLSSIQSFSYDYEFTLSETTECCIGFNFENGITYSGTVTFVIVKRVSYSVERTAYDGKARHDIDLIGVPVDFVQENGIIKVNNIITGVDGNQGMCVIDDVLCSCSVGAIYVKQSGDTILGTKQKGMGINVHNNDVDYCEYTDTLLTACLSDDNLPMALYLLQGAKTKLYSDTALTENDWTKILLPQELSDYDIVSNCFGEQCDIVYCILKDQDTFTNEDKKLLKIKLGYSNGIYDGTYTILSNRQWPHKIEVQGSKYCNGKLYIGSDSYIDSTVLKASVTVVDIDNLRTIEYPMYANEGEKLQRIEGEGIAFIGSNGYHLVSNHTNNIKCVRVFDRFNI